MAAAATNILLIGIPSGRLKLPNNNHHQPPYRPPNPIHFLSKHPNNNNNYKKKTPITFASGSPGLYSADQFELTRENVDLVLEDVRPYLIADGGDVDVVSVDNGVVSLQLQEAWMYTSSSNRSLSPVPLTTLGACGSCPSSTTTMRMGIERVLKEKFGDAIKEICQVYDEQINETTVEAVNSHLDILRPAIKNYGGSVQVLSVEGGDCTVKYVGPESIGSGIRAAIKEKFPDIVNVVLTD